MHDLTCSQGFLGIQSLVPKIEIILVFVQNKRVLEIQVIPWKGNHTPRKPGKKTKHHEVTPKLSFI
jgi:hypothetical protein